MKSTRNLAAALAVVCLPGAAFAQSEPQASDWHSKITLYGWLPSIGGTQSGPNEVPKINLDAEGVFDALNGAFFGSADFRKGDFGVVVDYAYADLSSDGTTERFKLPAEVSTELSMATLAATWRFHEDDRAWIEALGGMRGFDVNVGGELTLFGRDINASASSQWVEALIGLRGSVALTDRLHLTGIADISSGEGTESPTWELIGTIGYDFNDTVSGVLGYRYLSIDNASDDLKLDLDLYGPMVGLSFNF